MSDTDSGNKSDRSFGIWNTPQECGDVVTLLEQHYQSQFKFIPKEMIGGGWVIQSFLRVHGKQPGDEELLFINLA